MVPNNVRKPMSADVHWELENPSTSGKWCLLVYLGASGMTGIRRCFDGITTPNHVAKPSAY